MWRKKIPSAEKKVLFIHNVDMLPEKLTYWSMSNLNSTVNISSLEAVDFLGGSGGRVVRPPAFKWAVRSQLHMPMCPWPSLLTIYSETVHLPFSVSFKNKLQKE